MNQKMKNDDKKYYSCLYHCYGVRLELYLPDASWQPDIALLQTHVPGIEIDIETEHEHGNAENISNFNRYSYSHSPIQTLDNSLSSVFWKLAHPDMTFQIIVDCHDNYDNHQEENHSSHSSSLTIQQQSIFQKTVHLAIQLPSKFPDNSLHEDKKTIWKNDLPHFIYALLRQYWIEAGLSPVHSLCVGRVHRLSLVIGHSGTGKSTLASELLKLDYPVHSLDRTLVHINNIDNDINKNFNFNKKHVHLTQFAGTQVLSLRKNSININGNKHDDMNNDTNININTLLQSLNHSDSSQIYRVVAENDERIIIQMQSENHNNSNHVHANNINRIYLLNINDGEFKVSPLSPLSALHTLYPYFMDKIKEDIILGGGEIVFSGKISEKIIEGVQNQLIQKLKNLVESIPVATLWGSAEQCAQYLAFDSK